MTNGRFHRIVLRWESNNSKNRSRMTTITRHRRSIQQQQQQNGSRMTTASIVAWYYTKFHGEQQHHQIDNCVRHHIVQQTKATTEAKRQLQTSSYPTTEHSNSSRMTNCLHRRFVQTSGLQQQQQQNVNWLNRGFVYTTDISSISSSSSTAPE